jgi:ribosomal protein S19
MRVSRSSWKGPVLKILLKKNKNPIIVSRSSNITPNCVGLKFLVHNGKLFSTLEVTVSMIGHKFGEFSLTRKKFKFNK